VLSNLDEMVKHSQEFVAMEFADLKELLEDDELLVKDESDVYFAIQRWIEFSYVSRRNHYETLFQTIRLAFCKRSANSIATNSWLCFTISSRFDNTNFKALDFKTSQL
jgi:hypothetical protein